MIISQRRINMIRIKKVNRTAISVYGISDFEDFYNYNLPMLYFENCGIL